MSRAIFVWDDILAAHGRAVRAGPPRDSRGALLVQRPRRQQLRERGIIHWHVTHGVDDARLLSERPHTTPNPTVELEQILPDGAPVKAVWAYVSALDLAKLVTVHFFDK